MAAVEESLDALMVGCFALLPRLGEVESMVRGAGKHWLRQLFIAGSFQLTGSVCFVAC